jgi:Arc/MetJ family transcription regulator
MAIHMKTTIELSDALLAEAKRVAEERGTTLRAMFEAGLRRELREAAAAASFRLRDESVDGEGLRPELAGASWEEIRELADREPGG